MLASVAAIEKELIPMSPAYSARVESLEEARADHHARLNAHQTAIADNREETRIQAARIDKVLMLLVTTAFAAVGGLALQVIQMVKH